MFTVAASYTVIDSPYVNAENCKLYNAVSRRLRDGFVRHLMLHCWPYVLQMPRNARLLP